MGVHHSGASFQSILPAARNMEMWITLPVFIVYVSINSFQNIFMSESFRFFLIKYRPGGNDLVLILLALRERKSSTSYLHDTHTGNCSAAARPVACWACQKTDVPARLIHFSAWHFCRGYIAVWKPAWWWAHTILHLSEIRHIIKKVKLYLLLSMLRTWESGAYNAKLCWLDQTCHLISLSTNRMTPFVLPEGCLHAQRWDHFYDMSNLFLKCQCMNSW